MKTITVFIMFTVAIAVNAKPVDKNSVTTTHIPPTSTLTSDMTSSTEITTTSTEVTTTANEGSTERHPKILAVGPSLIAGIYGGLGFYGYTGWGTTYSGYPGYPYWG
ncbi:unnamed protein product [Orchesella dallaii]|uniref:Uncharacterized protein n=1 Tax=Orchesella dallaii TaxID=48710 RepID=A0ABP1PWW0_9HEXA